ncbi:ATP synthase F0 subunit B [Paraliomyxa miuraensis]|uniref:ATP synthase F0 subunit B n=1 Tax=Paraliomyxa miuraensis TaxID=376150 RepID=UPI002257AE49|nr:ATP synthase F0 subunit B [Paraliomyxa miuraensis]MCX4239570.1 ATP synthase F0 subunit B [Paraliomyxa miuraensis]
MFIQLGIYLGLVLILGPLLFRPWLEAQERRKQAVDGALAKSKTLRSEADEMARDYEQRIEAAREKAHGVRSEARREEETAQGTKLAAVRDEAAATLSRERERIASETSAARDSLASRVDELADTITAKLLGRAS